MKKMDSVRYVNIRIQRYFNSIISIIIMWRDVTKNKWWPVNIVFLTMAQVKVKLFDIISITSVFDTDFDVAPLASKHAVHRFRSACIPQDKIVFNR